MPRPTRPSLRLAVAVLALGLLAGCSSAPSGPPSIRVGIVCGGVGIAALAIDSGPLPGGVRGEKVCFESGSDAVQALAGGSIDAFVGAGEHIVNNRAKGLDVKGYAVVSEQPPYSLVAAAGSPVRSVPDVAGKSVAVTAPGSLSDTELQRATAEAGVPYRDLRVVGAGTGATMRAAIERGGAVAGMVTDPLLTTLRQAGATVVWEPRFRYVALAVIAKPDWVEENRPAMTGFLAGLRGVQDRAGTDRDGLLRTAQQETPGLDPGVLAPVLQSTLEQAPPGLRIDEVPYRETVDVLTQVGQTSADRAPSFADAFDFGPLTQP